MGLLQDDLAPRVAPVILANIVRRYPYHEQTLFREGDRPVDPTSAHPAFGNSFDWHSSVHSHWSAIQLLNHFASGTHAPPVASKLQEAIAGNLTSAHLASESAHLAAHHSYERPYGWAWALALAAAATLSPLQSIRALSVPLRDLAERIAESARQWLATMPGPVRHGVHSNSAFALGLMLDASSALGLSQLESSIASRARAWFEHDRDYPEAWERSAHDFLSPGLAEADLMRRLLGHRFPRWWRNFLPGASSKAAVFATVEVPNVSDGHIVHLHGLNLSRAAMLARIARALEEPQFVDQAKRLYSASVRAALGADYLSTHWLGTFAWMAASSIDAALEQR